jgi:2'-5' RNA ligase
MTTINLPGYKVNEYLLILNPHEELQEKILSIRRKFAEEHKTRLYTSRPNISIVKFTQYEMMEGKIVNNLKAVSMGLAPIKIELKDYGSFPTHTIFINVTTKVPFQVVLKKVRTSGQKLMKFDDDNKPHFFLEPYIPVAQKISQQLYEKAWLEYSHKQFTGRFIADSMLLLKREKGTLGYQIVERFEFQNLAVGVEQGQLFS